MTTLEALLDAHGINRTNRHPYLTMLAVKRWLTPTQFVMASFPDYTNRDVVTRLCKDGTLPAEKRGGVWYIDTEAL